MQTTRFLITGVGGQGTILASDVLAEVGLRLGYDAKKSDILRRARRLRGQPYHLERQGPRAHDR